MDQTPSFTFAKEHPGRRRLFGKMDGVFGGSVILLLIVVLIWLGSNLASSVFVNADQATQDVIKKEEISWDRKLEKSILAIPTRLTQVKDLLANHVYGAWVFDFLRANTLNNVSITSTEVKAKGTMISIQAFAPDFDTLARQIVWLRSQPDITGLILSAVSRDQGKVKFTLSLEISPQTFKKISQSH